MNPTPDRPATLAQALAALRDDLAAQPPPPTSVLAAARRAAAQARRTSAREGRLADPFVAGAPAGRGRLLPWLGSGLGGAGVASGRSGVSGLPGSSGAWGPWGAWAGAATCAVVLGVSLLLALRPPQMTPAPLPVAQPGAVPSPPTAQVAGAAGVADLAVDRVPAMHFVPLVSPERMRALIEAQGASGAVAGADTPAWVVTTELPQQRLAAMGLPYDPGHAADRVRAELLVAGSGEVLAVRLLF